MQTANDPRVKPEDDGREAGTGETPAAPVFIDSRKAATLRGPHIAAAFEAMVASYIERRWGAKATTEAAE